MKHLKLIALTGLILPINNAAADENKEYCEYLANISYRSAGAKYAGWPKDEFIDQYLESLDKDLAENQIDKEQYQQMLTAAVQPWSSQISPEQSAELTYNYCVEHKQYYVGQSSYEVTGSIKFYKFRRSAWGSGTWKPFSIDGFIEDGVEVVFPREVAISSVKSKNGSHCRYNGPDIKGMTMYFYVGGQLHTITADHDEDYISFECK